MQRGIFTHTKIGHGSITSNVHVQMNKRRKVVEEQPQLFGAILPTRRRQGINLTPQTLRKKK